MKKYKSVIAVLMAMLMIFAFTACASKDDDAQKQTEIRAVTNESGETVTDESGETVTEIVEVTENTSQGTTKSSGSNSPSGKTYSSGTVTTSAAKQNGNGKNTTTTTTKKESGKTTTKKAAISKPSKPADVSNLNASEIKQTSVKLTWSKVNCNGYQIAMSSDNGLTWSYLEKAYNKTSYTVKNLTSYTSYQFRVRAYNKNNAGTSTSAWQKVSVTTKANEEITRNITIKVKLPIDQAAEDTLTVYINGEKDGTATVKCDGSVYEYKTKKKYKGLVKIRVDLENTNMSKAAQTDKDVIEFDLSKHNIDSFYGQDD